MDSQNAKLATITTTTATIKHAAQNLLNSGAVDDLSWPEDRAKKNTKIFLQCWWKAQEGMKQTLSTVTYIQLKEEAKKMHTDVLDAAKTGDPNTFTVIAPSEEHHAIVDEHSIILGY